jgi:hypothetical protein
MAGAADLLDSAQLTELRAALAAKYPNAQIVAISARTGDGAEAWHEQMLHPTLRAQRRFQF